jgi:hypothetical protein
MFRIQLKCARAQLNEDRTLNFSMLQDRTSAIHGHIRSFAKKSLASAIDRRRGKSALLRLGGLMLPAVCLFNLPAFAGPTVSGTLSGDNTVYVYVSTDPTQQGTLITSGGTWQDTTSFNDVALTPGVVNYLHFEVVDTGSVYGLIGGFSLSGSGATFANGTTQLLTNATSATDWSGTFNSSGDPSTAPGWVATSGGAVSDEGANGTSPWVDLTNIDSSAHWIGVSGTPWSTDDGLFTVDFSTAIDVAAVPEPASLAVLGAGLAGIFAVRRRAKAQHKPL